VGDARERGQPRGDVGVPDAERPRRGGDRAGVAAVVGAGQRARLLTEDHAPGGAGHLDARRQDRDLPLGLAGEGQALGVVVGHDGTVPVEVVGTEAGEDRDVGGEGERVVQLEGGALADDDLGRPGAAGQRGQRSPDVPRDGHVAARPAQDVPEPLGDGGLPVRAGHRHERRVQQPPAELHLAEHGQPPLARGGDHGRPRRHPGGLDDRRGAPELGEPVRGQMDGEGGRRVERGRARVHADDLLTALGQQRARGQAGAGQPDDEPGPGGKRRPRHGGQEMDAW
jgi:hypothetical protein